MTAGADSPNPIDSPVEDDAEQAENWFEVDPFEDIPPSLLSSNEIELYVGKTGMISPFDVKALKTAAYAVGLGEKSYQLNKKGGIDPTILAGCENNLLKLPANSIVFVECGTKFKLPKYIAVRFNLRIGLVHRGLLLGTGPLVDPGFIGELLVPLHNLTSKDHYIDIRKHIIWMEFTKTTYKKPESGTPDRAEFLRRKQNKTPTDYLNDARKSLFDGRFVTIQSSIPGVFAKANKNATNALKIANKTERFVSGIGIAVLIGIFALGITTVSFLSSFVQNTYEQVDETRKNFTKDLSIRSNETNDLKKDIGQITARSAFLETQVKSLAAENLLIRVRYDAILKRIAQLENSGIQQNLGPPANLQKINPSLPSKDESAK